MSFWGCLICKAPIWLLDSDNKDSWPKALGVSPTSPPPLPGTGSLCSLPREAGMSVSRAPVSSHKKPARLRKLGRMLQACTFQGVVLGKQEGLSTRPGFVAKREGQQSYSRRGISSGEQACPKVRENFGIHGQADCCRHFPEPVGKAWRK